jgi:hypothetical protein
MLDKNFVDYIILNFLGMGAKLMIAQVYADGRQVWCDILRELPLCL